MSGDTKKMMLWLRAIVVVCALGASGCVFFGEAGGGDVDGGDTGDAHGADVADDTSEDATDTDGGINCSDDCRLVPKYVTENGPDAELADAELTLFETYELTAETLSPEGQPLTGCEVSYSVQSAPDARPIFAVDGSSLQPLALAQVDDQRVRVVAACDQGDLEESVSMSVVYPDYIPSTGEDDPPLVTWWSARSSGSVDTDPGNGVSWSWSTVDPRQDVSLGVGDSEHAPNLVRDAGPDAAVSMSASKWAFRRDSAGATESQRAPKITMTLAFRIQDPLPEDSVLPMFEQCAGPNNQLRIDEGDPDQVSVVVDGEEQPVDMERDLEQSKWVTISLVFDEGEAVVYREESRVNQSALAFTSTQPSLWEWSALMRGCKASSPTINLEVADVLVVESALGPDEIQQIVTGLRARLDVP